MDASEPTAAFSGVVGSVDQLRSRYRDPSRVVLAKETTVLDDACREFIAASTFVLVGTSNAEGRMDVSPRGGPSGFVHVLDDRRLAIPDLNGNNRLDSLVNIIDHGRVGLLFLIPGMGEMLRVNGDACVTVDDAVLDRFDEVRRPASAIGVTIDHAFLHCAKAVRRGGLWQPDQWPEAAGRPSPGRMLVDHAGLGDSVTASDVERGLEAGYERDLAADRPEPAPRSAPGPRETQE